MQRPDYHLCCPEGSWCGSGRYLGLALGPFSALDWVPGDPWTLPSVWIDCPYRGTFQQDLLVKFNGLFKVVATIAIVGSIVGLAIYVLIAAILWKVLTGVDFHHAP